MELIIFSGIQAAGKSSYFQTHFADTHVRINLDMLRTRHREHILFTACLAAKQALVIDNTNLTATERARYIQPAQAAGFRILAYRFFIDPELAIARNAQRSRRIPVPAKALRASAARWQIPTPDEGFSAIHDVHATSGI